MAQIEPDIQNTVDVLLQMHHGSLMHDVAVNIQEAAMKTRELRKATEVTIKLVFTPAAQGDISPVLVKGQTTLKVPPVERGATILFTTEEGRLSRNDPRQSDFFAVPVKVVEQTIRVPRAPEPLAQAVGDEKPVRERVHHIDTGTGEILDD